MATTMFERRPLTPGRRQMTPSRPLPSSRVCKSLFGPVDHEETNRVLQREVNRYQEEYKRKYNFDFVNDVPLPGVYDWRVDVHPSPNARLSAPMKLRLTIPSTPMLSSEGEDTEPETPVTPETPGSFCSERGSSDESDCCDDTESPLERCIRRNNYDLRTIHPASTPDSTPIADAAGTSNSSSAPNASSATSSCSSSSSQHARPLALYSPAKRSAVDETVVECAPVSLDPIIEGCRSPAESSASSQPRQTKITDFLRQRKRKLSAADTIISKKILRGSPFRAGASGAAAAASPAAAIDAAAAAVSGTSVQ